MAGRRICAGYYRRYDGKVVYVVSLATDTDTGEEAVIWTTYPFADLPRYWTSSKKSFCAFVGVDGERKVKYKRLTNMKISEAAVKIKRGRWMKNMTPASISNLSPTSHTPKTCVRTTTSTGANTTSA